MCNNRLRLIDHERYLDYAASLKDEERSCQDYMMEWLPDMIIDGHTHCNLLQHVVSIDEISFNHIVSTFPGYDLTSSAMMHELIFPRKVVQALRFPNVFPGIDQKSANSFLLDQTPEEDRVAIFGLPDDVDYTISLLRHPRVSGLKMYYTSVAPPADKIYDFFKPAILEEAQRLDRPVILHLPWAITISYEDLKQFLSDFPFLRTVIAHLGLTSFPISGLTEVYDRFKDIDRVFFDTSLVQSSEVIHLALKSFGPERLMYGSDEPFCFIRANTYKHPQFGERLISEFPYHWSDPEERANYGHLAINPTHLLWKSLKAIQEAICLLPKYQRDRSRHQIFYGTAKDVFGF